MGLGATAAAAAAVDSYANYLLIARVYIYIYSMWRSRLRSLYIKVYSHDGGGGGSSELSHYFHDEGPSIYCNFAAALIANSPLENYTLEIGK